MQKPIASMRVYGAETGSALTRIFNGRLIGLEITKNWNSKILRSKECHG